MVMTPGRFLAITTTAPFHCRRHYYTYQLGSTTTSSTNNHTTSTLYIPLTSYCNTMTLPETRGPKFVLPPQAVASLCRVRDAEAKQPQWEFWCRWLDQQEAYQKLPAPSPASRVVSLDERDKDEDEPPSVTCLVAEVADFLQHTTTASMVIGGEGEPTLRWRALIGLLEQLSPLLENVHPAAADTANNSATNTVTSAATTATPSCTKKTGSTIRIHTNGLLLGGEEEHRILQLLTAGSAMELSIPLMTHDPDQYDQLMQPLVVQVNDSDANSRPHERVVRALIRAIAAGVVVDVTAVDRPDVDRIRTEALAESLGVTTGVRWRRWYGE